MTAVMRIGAAEARQLLSGGWMCDRGDAFPTWRPDADAAARLLRSWLPAHEFPAAAAPRWRGGITPGPPNLPRIAGPGTPSVPPTGWGVGASGGVGADASTPRATA
jgi:hypothetical protein